MSSYTKVIKSICGVKKVKIKNVDLSVDAVGQECLYVDVDLYKSDECRCPVCNKKCIRYDRPSHKRKWRCLDLGGTLCYITMDTVRVFCKEHGVKEEAVPFAYQGSTFVKNFDLVAAYFAKAVSTSFVSEYLRISWLTVGRCVARARKDLDPELSRRFNNLIDIGIDETSYKKGHSYITIVVNHRTNEVVWIGLGHDFATISRFFEELSQEQRESIQNVSGDGARWIDKAIETYIPWATRCLDSYHVCGWANEALNEVRKECWHKSKDKLNNANTIYSKGRPTKDDKQREELKEINQYASAIKNSTYALGKNPENLTEGQITKLTLIQNNEPHLYRAYLLKEDLRTILHCKDLVEAKRLLDSWLNRACHSKIKQMVELSRKIRRHKCHILNTIERGLSNARIESINNKIKLIIRKAFGFRNLENMMNMIYLVCSSIKIPLPNRPIKETQRILQENALLRA